MELVKTVPEHNKKLYTYWVKQRPNKCLKGILKPVEAISCLIHEDKIEDSKILRKRSLTPVSAFDHEQLTAELTVISLQAEDDLASYLGGPEFDSQLGD